MCRFFWSSTEVCFFDYLGAFGHFREKMGLLFGYFSQYNTEWDDVVKELKH